jgi:hypothetical protein
MRRCGPDRHFYGPRLDVGDVEIGFEIIKNLRRSQLPRVGLGNRVGEIFIDMVGSGLGR